MAFRVADLLSDPRHAGPLLGAPAAGAAREGDRQVEVGLWLDPAGRVERARFRATSCAALIAYAEAACSLAEASGRAGVPADRIREAVTGVHPLHRGRAELVARAFAAAEQSHRTPGAPP